MGYFMGSQEVPITGSGTTVSNDEAFTANCLAVATSGLTYLTPSVVIGIPEIISEAASSVAQLEIYGYSTRECFAVATQAVAELDLGINTSSLLYYDTTLE